MQLKKEVTNKLVNLFFIRDFSQKHKKIIFPTP